MIKQRPHPGRPGSWLALLLAIAAPAVAQDGPPTIDSADQRFEKLQAAFLKDPARVHYRDVRRAFGSTTFYAPYDLTVPEKLREISLAIGRGELQESEAALLKLARAERQMRLDTLAMLQGLYEKMGRTDDALRVKARIAPILDVLFEKGSGQSLETAIPILFIQEEYLVTVRLRVKEKLHVVHDGHKYDVFTLEARDGQPSRKVYFQVDLPRKAIGNTLDLGR